MRSLVRCRTERARRCSLELRKMEGSSAGATAGWLSGKAVWEVYGTSGRGRWGGEEEQGLSNGRVRAGVDAGGWRRREGFGEGGGRQDDA